MGWNCIHVTCRSAGPLRVGWHKLGFIERTRYYVPARALLGALVARAAPVLAKATGVAAYSEMQKLFHEAFRSTCLFPVESASGPVLRPRFSQEGLCYGSLTSAKFETLYVFSHSSTALAAASLTAEEGSLHESEYLLPGLFYTGYLFLNDTLPVRDIESVLEEFAVGGDRNYGWGRMRLDSTTPVPVGGSIFDEFAFLDGTSCPVLLAPRGAALPVHLQASGAELIGDLELVAGREWHIGGAGRRVAAPILAWTPGSCFERECRIRPRDCNPKNELPDQQTRHAYKESLAPFAAWEILP